MIKGEEVKWYQLRISLILSDTETKEKFNKETINVLLYF